MLNRHRIRAALPIGRFGGGFHFHRTIGSTNDEAVDLARRGAPEGTLVIADEQTTGRGRSGRRWFTPAGAALALSVVLRPGPEWVTGGGLMALGSLALAEALERDGLRPQIKWPNDVLVGGRKLAGVLVEAAWTGRHLDFAVCGIGVNVRPASVPPDQEVDYPATCVEAARGQRVDREDLLLAILTALDRWYSKMGSQEALQALEERLAFVDERVAIRTGSGQEMIGRVLGLAADGRLRLEAADGEVILIGAEGSHLRPLAA